VKAMILAAGRGTRLGALTQTTPKPLMPVRGLPVIDHTLRALAPLGISQVVINCCHLADILMAHVGDGARWNLHVQWSHEPVLLETGGGVCQALPLLGDEPFLAINGDILWHMDLEPFLGTFRRGCMGALLGLIPPPADRGLHGGDFIRHTDGTLVRGRGRPGSLTYTGIQVLDPQVLRQYPVVPFSLNRVYDDLLAAGQLYGEPLAGAWSDIGAPQSLRHADLHWPHIP
jgi:MurNAc alpha-1-phosphate uridylyltransferase